jgi:ribosomal protein S18 acetylase RimI-like enzyme
MVDKWVFCGLNKSLDRQSFDCGVAELNDYLQRYASQNHRKGIATTFVALASTEDLQIAGYYSVSMAEITVEVLPIEFQKGLPRYPIPAMRVGRLAVDITRRGEGLGKALLMECFRRAIVLSREIGIFAIVVDATNESAIDFYLKYGFIQLPSQPMYLFIPLATIGK